MEKIIIRMANINDSRAIARIRIDGWRNAFRGVVSDETLDAFDFEKETAKIHNTWFERNCGEKICVAEVSGGVKGFCIFDTVKEESRPKAINECGEIIAFYVDPSSMRSGIGKSIFDFVCNKFRSKKFDNMCVWTLTENRIGRNFYEKVGGNPIGERNREIRGEMMNEVGYLFQI